ncbi:hypothetical protein HF086_000229 [Spodoptera exigua]|uniref:Uncharacterized protein n=1 Tax=Spodoptera exigua TaxID=7107 RepID=A0A922MD37_SPOEX|nr:hypothetical protein HF086_000229 [Spodoptera exigua]
MIFVGSVTSLVRLVLDTYRELAQVREFGLSALSSLWLLGLLADPFFNIFMCVLVLDLIEDDYNYIKIKCSEQKILCKSK